MVLLILSIPKTYIFSKVCNNLGNYNTEYNVVRDDQRSKIPSANDLPM
jgi:hypothetical protein